jgi:hypothetical protein
MIDPTAFKVGDLVQFDSEGSKILGLVVGLDNNGIFIDWLSGSQALDSATCRYHQRMVSKRKTSPRRWSGY